MYKKLDFFIAIFSLLVYIIYLEVRKMEELVNLMKKNNIDTKMLSLFNIRYFTKDMIDYIINLHLEGHNLETLIYLVCSGIFTKIDEKEYFKIIRLIKESKSIEEDIVIKTEILNNKYKYKEKSM